MLVAFCIRPDWRERHGGDVVQFLETSEALRRLFGIEVLVIDDPNDDQLQGVDIAHVFNVQDPEVSLRYTRVLGRCGKPYVLSTVFWDLRHATYASLLSKAGRHSLSPGDRRRFELFDRVCRLCGRAMGRPGFYARSYVEGVRELVEGASALLPNSSEEADQLRRYLGSGDLPPVHVVVNAVSLENFRVGEADRVNGVLMAARVEPTKNQLGLLQGLQERPDISVTICGRVVDHKYGAAVEKILNQFPHSTILSSGLPQGELAKLMQSVKVHALPSFRESPGLSTLEALACGCSVVVSSSEFAPTDTYFSELIGSAVFECDPYDPSSIESAVEDAMGSNPRGVRDWLVQFSWENAARQTFEAYQTSLAGGKQR